MGIFHDHYIGFTFFYFLTATLHQGISPNLGGPYGIFWAGFVPSNPLINYLIYVIYLYINYLIYG